MPQGETHLAKERFYIRRDARGISIMSTLCTRDLYPLRLDAANSEWISDYSGARYSLEGKVVKGPAVKDLPYYKLELREGVIEGPIDTLYVVVGREVNADWRLSVGAP